MKKMIIAIDGHSSTGKSTFAKAIAIAMDYTYLDSGALYRAVTLYALEQGLTDKNGRPHVKKLVNSLKDIFVTFRRNPLTGRNETFLNEKNVEQRIRNLDVSQSVSPVSGIPQVREFVDIQLRKWGKQKGIVMDGRDIGTAVFPEAEVKIFMTAPAEIRARRRYDEMKAKGEEASFEEVLENVRKRDQMDSHRATHPLVMAPDAVLLDNGNMSVEEQMEWFKKLLEEKWGIRLK
ncbi:MAG: (d)CMP kinase [Bacteroidales bacterium]|jgi:cytidylate kinase|nr:(d)CMP kinase [Bacteroidales bacterium]MDD2264179.1 (d)CMP kinase [Bacteroidales bacterium]MDD2831350.1 (d)CMP kinase [Bacteroidales bacterium]MDD3208344.1 (d)CMP kinase [Bacteroidales bacterium]MDD3696973.1 (d)CMP kinase [Bacteroidales bacterium]